MGILQIIIVIVRSSTHKDRVLLFIYLVLVRYHYVGSCRISVSRFVLPILKQYELLWLTH
jgi:hypothetical protein